MYAMDVPVALYSACRTWGLILNHANYNARGAHLDGTVKDGLKLYFTEQFVWKYMRICVILLPHLLTPVDGMGETTLLAGRQGCESEYALQQRL